jgi:hypothetical protein
MLIDMYEQQASVLNQKAFDDGDDCY